MNNDYLRSIWRSIEEEKAHACLEEVFLKRGFTVTNLHRDDRIHESGVDLLCTKPNESVSFAVKKKPKQEDIPQLKKLSNSNPLISKSYIYLDSPTRPFEKAIKEYTNVNYISWDKFHSMLVEFGSVKYVLLYFSAHKLYENLSSVFAALYDKRNTSYYKHAMDIDEKQFLWNIKDDAVKLKSILEYLYTTWQPLLLSRLDYDSKEWTDYIETLHSNLDNVNNIAGESLRNSFIKMSDEFPHLAARYWKIVSYRTIWKDFTATAIELGKQSQADLQDFIRYEWVMPTLKPSRRRSEYGPCKTVYSTLLAIIENTHNIAEDIEDGIDWLHEDLLQATRLRP